MYCFFTELSSQSSHSREDENDLFQRNIRPKLNPPPKSRTQPIECSPVRHPPIFEHSSIIKNPQYQMPPLLEQRSAPPKMLRTNRQHNLQNYLHNHEKNENNNNQSEN